MKNPKEFEDESPQARGGKKRRLRSIINVRSFVAHVLRELEGDRMDADKARALLYGAKILAELIQGSSVEERIAALEQKGVTYGPGDQTSVSQ